MSGLSYRHSARILGLLVGGWLLCVPAARSQDAVVAPHDLETRDGLYYLAESDTPFTGTVRDPGVEEGRVENGRRVGRWTSWHPNGQVDAIVAYENGQVTRLQGWHANGVKRIDARFADGRPEGTHTRWAESGHMISEQTFRAGRLEGTRRLWTPKGRLLLTAAYRDGVPDGDTTWWYDDGAKRWETHYDEGRRTGTWTQYAPDGRVVMQSTWDGDREVSRSDPHAGHR